VLLTLQHGSRRRLHTGHTAWTAPGTRVTGISNPCRVGSASVEGAAPDHPASRPDRRDELSRDGIKTVSLAAPGAVSRHERAQDVTERVAASPVLPRGVESRQRRAACPCQWAPLRTADVLDVRRQWQAEARGPQDDSRGAGRQGTYRAERAGAAGAGLEMKQAAR
jgi:hypothetical protein